MRQGRRNQPSYRIVINEQREKMNGKYIEQVGFYNPMSNPKDLRFDVDRYQHWIKQGAQPTDTVAALFKRSQEKNA